MVKQKHILIFLNHEEKSNFKTKRLVFEQAAREAPQLPGSAERLKDEPNADETIQVREALKKLDVNVPFIPDGKDNLENLAKKLYPSPGKEQKAAKNLLVQTFKEKQQWIWYQANEQKCTTVRAHNGDVEFYKGNNVNDPKNEIKHLWTTIPTPTGAAEAKKPDEAAPQAPNAALQKPGESAEDKAILDRFKNKWFKGAKNIEMDGTNIAPGNYTLNVDPGKPIFVYDNNKEVRETSDNALNFAYHPEVKINNGKIVTVDGTPYVMINSAKINGKTEKMEKWVPHGHLSEIGGEKYEQTIETKGPWGNPDKGSNTASIKGKIDKTGTHSTKADTAFTDYEGKAMPAIGKGQNVEVLDGNIYNINGTDYVRVRYREAGGRVTEGWAKPSDLYTDEKLKVEKTDLTKKEEDTDAKIQANRAKFETGKGGALHFETEKLEKTWTLKKHFEGAQDGDTVEVTPKGELNPRIATFNGNGKGNDFYYSNGQRAIILEGDKLGEYKKAPRLKGNEQAPEDVNSIGSVQLHSPEDRPELKTKFAIANTILKAPPEKLKELGFTFTDPALLEDLRKSNIAPELYADRLKQVGDKVFVTFVTKTPERSLQELQTKAVERSTKAATKIDKRTQAIIDQKMGKLDGNLSNFSKNIIALADNAESWNKVWDHEQGGVIVGKDRLIQAWRMVPPYNRSENELRDLVRKFVDKKGADGADLKTFVDIFEIYKKTDGSSGTSEELLNEWKKVKADYAKIKPEVLNNYSSGKAEAKFDRIQQQISINRATYGYDADTRKLYRGLSKEDIEFAAGVFQSNDYKTYERFQYLDGVIKGSILTMDAIGKLKYGKNPTETVSARPLNLAESRVNQIFDRNDKGATASDIATEGRKGKVVEFSLLPFIKGGIKVINENPKFFNKYTSGEAAWMRTLDKCRDEKGEVDEKQLVDHLNTLLAYGIWGISRNPDIKPEEIYQAFGIKSSAPDSDKLLLAKLQLQGKDPQEALAAPKDANVAKYQKMLIEVGYLVEASATEGKVETGNLKGKNLSEKIDLAEKLSTSGAIRKMQMEAIKMGYPINEIEKVEQIIKNAMVAGALVDLGGNGRGPGAGLGLAIPIGYGLYVGGGVGYFNHGLQFAGAIGYSKDITKNISAGVGAGAGVPVTGPQAGKPAVSVGAGVEFTIPIDKSDWDLWISAGASTDLVQDFKKNGNVLLGLGIGGKWNPDKAMDSATKEKLANYKLDKIDEALAKNDSKQAVDLINQHPALGKIAALMTLEYGWGDDDVIKMYQEHKQALRNAAAEDVNPVITRVGITGGVSVDATGLKPMIGGVIAFNVAKTVTLYRTESRTGAQMLQSGGQALDDQLRKKAAERFGVPQENVHFSNITKIEERAQIVHDKDGQPAIDPITKTIDLRGIRGERGLAEYNAEFKAASVELKKGAGEESGLIEIDIPELSNNRDPAYNKRATRFYIDPEMMERVPSKGLVLRNGKIFLAAASPDVFLRRLDYHTAFGDDDGASAHSIFVLTDVLPPPDETEQQREAEIARIMKSSDTYLYKRPNQPLHIRSVEDKPKQWNIQDFEAYQRYRGSFERYAEHDWTPYQNAIQNRETTFVSVKDVPIREGLIPPKGPETDTATNCFAKRFYDKNRTAYKLLTTGDHPDIKQLFEKIDGEWAKDPANKDRTPLTVAEKNQIFLDLTRRSWANIEKLSPQEKEKKFQERRNWARETLLPIWTEKTAEINKKNPGAITNSPKVLVDYVINNLGDTDLNGLPTKLPEGSLTNTLAGTENIIGFRANNGAEALLGLDQYAGFLGQNNKNGEVARIILESLSPLPEGPNSDAEFMQSPLALRVLSKRALVLAWGLEDFNRITECYKALKTSKDALNTALQNAENRAVFNKFRDLVNKIRAAELNPSGGNILKLDNGCYIKLKPLNIAAGIDKSCANFSMTEFEDFDVLVASPNQVFALAGRAREHNTITASETPSWFQFGIGAMGTIKPKETPTPPTPPPPPNLPKTPAPIQNPGGKVVVAGGHMQGGTTNVNTANTSIGRGNGDNPDNAP